jgi:hypothetical protein
MTPATATSFLSAVRRVGNSTFAGSTVGHDAALAAAGRESAATVRRQPGEDPVHVPGAGWVEAGRRFVEHQESRRGQQRGGKTETLAHSE